MPDGSALSTPPQKPPGLWSMLREDIGCVKARDPAARYAFEIVLTYPGVHALIWHRFAHALWRRGLKLPARCISWFGRLVSNVDIHPGAQIGRRFFIDHGACVVIGETAIIGDDVTMYHGVTLGGVSWSPGKRHPTVEDGVLIGCGAKVLGPITIGKGARVGANSVVVEDTPPGMTVVGIPGRLVRERRVGHSAAGRVNLDHHLIPDPVSDVLSMLIDRIDFLEERLAHMQHRERESVAGKQETGEPNQQSEAEA